MEPSVGAAGAAAVRRATLREAGDIARLIATSFERLDVNRWLVPDPAQRAQVMPAYFEIIVSHALTHGTVYTAWFGDDLVGAAAWFIRERDMPPQPPNYQSRLVAVCGEAAPRFQHLDKLLEDNHPTQPHHHLCAVAVHPDYQGRGFGSQLLKRQHAQLDLRGKSAYLEAVEPARPLYERLGYHAVYTEPLRLPDGTPMWPMWRTAGPRR